MNTTPRRGFERFLLSRLANLLGHSDSLVLGLDMHGLVNASVLAA